MSSSALMSVNISSLKHIASGKVRELYQLNDGNLLMIATDRVSAFDVILQSAIPQKGQVLTQISSHWFDVLSEKVPGFKHHLLSLKTPSSPETLTAEEAKSLHGRCMTVRSLKVFPIEVIVRGYLTGSAWNEYQKKGTVHGLAMPAGLQNCSQFPGGAIYTPSTKAPQGQSDENISPDQAAAIVGDKYAKRIEALALQLYSAAHEYALARGLVLADTKFEFGLDEATDEIILIDEVLTPDSSRYWPAPVQVGQEQPSFDKQFVRKYLIDNGLKGKEGVALPEEVVKETANKYREVYKMLTGTSLDETLEKLEK